MNKKLLIGLLGAGIIFGGAFAVGASDDMDLYDNKTRTAVNTTAATNMEEYNKELSQKEAVSIAEKAVNGKAIEVELDDDDGMLKYEIELQTDRGEAEVEIAAVTGEILEIEFDD